MNFLTTSASLSSSGTNDHDAGVVNSISPVIVLTNLPTADSQRESENSDARDGVVRESTDSDIRSIGESETLAAGDSILSAWQIVESRRVPHATSEGVESPSRMIDSPRSINLRNGSGVAGNSRRRIETT